jgi:hypothetical protein
MRAMAAAVVAGVAGLLILTQTSDQPQGYGGPSGRASARRPHTRAERADGGSAQDGGEVSATEPVGGASAQESPGGGNLRGEATRPTTRERAPRILGDPPGKVRISSAETTPADAGQPPENRAQVDKLEQQVGELRGRTAALEAQLARSQGQAAQLQRINDQMAELRAQIAAESQRKAQAEEAQAAQRQQVQEAVSGLVSAQQILAGGSADVSDALSQAEAAFEGDAKRDVAAARQALQNRDLAAARYYLGAAVAHAERQTR